MTVEKNIYRMLPDPAGIEPPTSWSPVGRASEWATEAGEILVYVYFGSIVNNRNKAVFGLMSDYKRSQNWSL